VTSFVDDPFRKITGNDKRILLLVWSVVGKLTLGCRRVVFTRSWSGWSRCVLDRSDWSGPRRKLDLAVEREVGRIHELERNRTDQLQRERAFRSSSQTPFRVRTERERLPERGRTSGRSICLQFSFLWYLSKQHQMN